MGQEKPLIHELGLYQVDAVHSDFLSRPWLRTWLLPLACAFLLAVFLTSVLVRIAPKTGWIVVPRPDRWSTRVVAQFGGVPVLLAFSITLLWFFPTRDNLTLLLLTWGMALLGLADDLAHLSPKAKLFGQALIAGLAVYFGIVHPLTAHSSLNAAFTVFWIVGITNSINLLDNMDGLAAGVVIIASAQVILLAGPANPVSGLALCMLASSAGFLMFNFNPAKVFMGDVGALSTGFFVACASVKTVQHLSSLGSILFVPCLVLFIPVFDTLLVSVTRRINGRRISLGARDHASHRLVLIGLSERQAVALLYLIAVTAGVMGFLWKSSWGDLGAGLVGLFLIGSTLFWVYLAQLQLPSDWLSPVRPGIIAIPKHVQQRAVGISLILLDMAAISLGLYFAYVMKFERLDRILFGRFLFAAALSLGIKLPLLFLFGAYRGTWSITSRRDAYPILKTVALAVCLLTAASVALPASKAIESSIILFDAVFTCSLLVLCRASSRIFDEFLGKRTLLDLTVKRLVSWASLKPLNSIPQKPPGKIDISAESAPEDHETEQRPN
jgi:UDP-GlcNAc:undecaprenyl-phosphate/decaprenyl-phosphate GlcNAc-1-phosphate transferase